MSQKELCDNRDIIEDFIKRRFDIDCHWLDGNCYFFAMILTRRFPSLYKVYFPIEGHWMATDDEFFYDFNGACKKDGEVFYTEDWLIQNDIDLYCRIVEDSIR